MPAQEFYHVPNFTGYMGQVVHLLDEGERGKKILDMPAGNGLAADQLRTLGHRVTCADINREKPDYIFADLNERLPFADGEFDAVLCTEGIEHTLTPHGLIAELCRVTRLGGRIVLSTPNVQCAFSRFQFMCTGSFYQFSPLSGRHLPPGEMKDRGHISPMSYLQLRYFFQYHGAKLTDVSADRWKKKWLIPFLLPFIAIGWLWTRCGMAGHGDTSVEYREMVRHLFSRPLLFGRSLVLVFQKISQ
jgi:SAM-dependent methyltransferase